MFTVHTYLSEVSNWSAHGFICNLHKSHGYIIACHGLLNPTLLLKERVDLQKWTTVGRKHKIGTILGNIFHVVISYVSGVNVLLSGAPNYTPSNKENNYIPGQQFNTVRK